MELANTRLCEVGGPQKIHSLFSWQEVTSPQMSTVTASPSSMQFQSHWEENENIWLSPTTKQGFQLMRKHNTGEEARQKQNTC